MHGALLNSREARTELEKSNPKGFSRRASFHRQDRRFAKCRLSYRYCAHPNRREQTAELGPIQRASAMIGSVLKKRDIVVYKSTVYPGVTEDVCVPILEQI